MRERTPEQIRRQEEERLQEKAYQTQLSEILLPLFAKYDPESLIALTPAKFHEDPAKTHYECIVEDVAQAIMREGATHISIDGLAHIISLASHIHYEQWSQPVRTYSKHFSMAKELQPLIPEWRYKTNADSSSV
jgi:hypothetical protein